MDKSPDYRPDVDGLRAIAVLTVLLFHLRVPGFDGGFVGVDIFYVISGFLITGIIWRQLDAGTFGFWSFMERRARRLLPASAVTIAATFLAGAFLLSPETLQQLGASAIAAAFSLSNILFWSESGYFDADARMKPLLHMWSLGIEWQFYVMWPFLLAAFWSWRDRIPPLVLVLVTGAISLALNVAFAGDDNSTIFFLPIFRVFEFAIGGALIWLQRASPSMPWVREVTLLFGFVLIAASAFAYDENTVFPSFAALVPCIGAALIIWAPGSPGLGRIASSRPFVWIGETSYSIYLVHWPLITIYEMGWTPEPTAVDQTALFLGSIILGRVLHVFVEKPFRYQKGKRNLSGRTFALAGIGLTLFAVVPAAQARLGDGWAWRISPEIRELLASAKSEAADRYSYFKDKSCFVSSVNGDYFKDFGFSLCMTPETSKINVLLIGDSLAAYGYHGIRANAGSDINVMQNTVTGCAPMMGYARGKNCEARNRDFYENGSRYKADLVVMMANWPDKQLDLLGNSIEVLRARGQRVLVIGPSVSFEKNLSDIIAGSMSVAAAEIGSRRYIHKFVFDSDERIRSIAQAHGALYYSPLYELCSKATRSSCTTIIDGRIPISLDQWHLLPSAAEYVFKDIVLDGGPS